MLRLLILLECDECKEVLTSTPNTSSPLGIDWTEEIYRIECDAEQSGWSVFHPKFDQHVCDACVMNAMAEQHT